MARLQVGIDLHSAAIHRTNLPQLRLTPGNDRLTELGEAFGAPVMMHSKLRDGSLCMASSEAGVSGILRVMHHLEMIGNANLPRYCQTSVLPQFQLVPRPLWRAFARLSDHWRHG